jgi:hypothetical protein
MIFDYLVLIIGISGVITIATNYILEASKKLKEDRKMFSILNLYGSIALLIYSAYNLVYLFIILNTFLVLVGIYGIYIVYLKNRR